jgi:hypothetical protein
MTAGHDGQETESAATTCRVRRTFARVRGTRSCKESTHKRQQQQGEGCTFHDAASPPIFRSIGAEGQRTFPGAFVVSACSRAMIIQETNERRVSVSQQDYHSSV